MRGRAIWAIAAALLVLLAGLLLLVLPQRPSEGGSEQPSPATAQAPRAPAEPEPVDLGPALGLGSLTDCAPSPVLASILDRMVRSDPETFESRRGGPIRVPGHARPLIPTFERRREIDGRADMRAVAADLDFAGRWHGLAVAGLTRSFYEESDVSAFQVRFAEPPERVRETLDPSRLPPACGRRDARVRRRRPFDLHRHRADRGRSGADMRDGMSSATGAHRLRNIIGGSAGNLVEWYDWYIYAAFALYFAPVFFPRGRPDRAAAEHGGDLRGRLRDAADRRLDHGHLCRQQGAQGRADAFGQPDVRRAR